MMLAKLFARTVGVLSHGVALSLKEGLISAKVIDYVFLNQPSGKGWMGKWIDQRFLSHPGWDAIRMRRRLLEDLLREAILERSGPLKLIDLASGAASYLISLVKEMKSADLEVICQDLNTKLLEEGRRAAIKAGLKNLSFRKGNAFDAQAMVSYHPQIVVSSGFYDGIRESAQIKNSIALVYKALPISGAFILTIQTDRPNFHRIESIFPNLNKKRVTHSADELILWLQAAGFQVEKTLRDPYGCFAVFKAKKL